MRTTRRHRAFRIAVMAVALVAMLAASAALATPDGMNIETEAAASPPDHANSKRNNDKGRQNKGGDRGRKRGHEKADDGVLVVDVDDDDDVDDDTDTDDDDDVDGATDADDDDDVDDDAGEGSTDETTDSTSAEGDTTTTAGEGSTDETTTTGPDGTTTTTAAGGDPTTTSGTGSETTTGSGGGSGGNVSPPIRAAFFYPWFPHAWRQSGVDPFTNFTPSLGRYSSSDPDTIRQQLDLADDAHIAAFIASWWGRGHHTDEAMPALLDTTTSAGSPAPDLKWTIYYEPEGYGDPSASELLADLRYLSANYFNHPAYLTIDGKPVVFVWAESSDGAGMAQRWAEAKAQFGGKVHVVLKVYSGYRSTGPQPDSWHQYGPAVGYSEHPPHSATVSPGFWLVGEGPRLDRNLSRFEQDVIRMNNAGTFWQLVTTWNEWGEGTSIEPAAEFGADYINALAQNPPNGSGATPSDPTTSTTTDGTTTTTALRPTSSTTDPGPAPTSSPSGSVRFTAGGDHGANSRSDASFGAIADLGPRFHLALGDLSYGDTDTEAEWCDYVKGHLGNTPVQLVVGNHEDDDRPDGYIGEFVKCLPDRMNSTGTYGAEYYFDVDGLVRVIMIGAGNDVAGVDYNYDRGTSHHQWLASAIDDAAARGIPWVVVGMHKVCVTAGKKPCEVGPDVIELLIEKRVDLVLHGHEHNYQRSKQVSCVEVDRYRPDCVVDDGSDGVYRQGAGLVWAIAGNFGGSGMYEVNRGDPEYGYFAASLGGGDPDSGRGFLLIDAMSDRLDVRFVGSTTPYTDSFSIRR